MPYKAKFLSPMIPSTNMDATVQFFVSLFGFNLVFQSKTYRIVEKDNLTLHILPAGENISEMEFYIEVDDVEAVWHLIKDKIAEYKHRAPFNQDYKMREIHIEVAYTKALMFIGQSM